MSCELVFWFWLILVLVSWWVLLMLGCELLMWLG